MKRFRAALKLPCMQANVSYKSKRSDDSDSPIVMKKARKALKFDETED